MILSPKDTSILLQRLLFEHNAELTQGAFVMAIQNQDLAIIKLLIEKARNNESSLSKDVELGLFGPFQKPDWMERLLESGNHFLLDLIKKDTKISDYFEKVYEEETGKEFPKLDDNVEKVERSTSIKLDDIKGLYELQLLDGDLDLNMMINSNLNLAKNVVLMILNNKKHFDKKPKLIKILEKFFEYRRYCSVSFLFKKYPKLMEELTEIEQLMDQSFIIVSGILRTFPEKFGGPRLEKYLTQAMQEANLDLISEYIDNFSILSSNVVAFNLWIYALQHCEIQVIYHILDKVPNLKKTEDCFIKYLLENDLRTKCLIVEDYKVLSQVSINAIGFLLRHFHEQFGGKPMEQSLVQALDDSNLWLINSFIDEFKILSQEEISENLWKYVLQNSDIDAIYEVLDKITHLKNSDDHLIKFLLSTDLRTSNISTKDINFKMDTYPYCTPLHLAADVGSPEIVKILINHGADLTATDDMTFTALHIAAEKNHTLRKNKASVKLRH